MAALFAALRLMSELSTFPDRLLVPPGLYVTVSGAPPVLPAASCAVTVIAFTPDTSATLAMLQLPVPVALPLALFAALRQVTLVTPTLSDAVPANATVALPVE